MTRLLDLSKVVPPDIRVELPPGSGNHFELPGDPPMEIYARMLDLQQQTEGLEGEEAVEGERQILEGTFDTVLALFRVRQPDLDADELRGIIGIHEAVAILTEVMSVYGGDEELDSARPTTPPSKKSSARSGSRRASASSRS